MYFLLRKILSLILAGGIIGGSAALTYNALRCNRPDKKGGKLDYNAYAQQSENGISN